MAELSRRGYWVRLAISVAIDVLDFTFGRIPIFGAIGEGAGTLLLVALWGPAGFFYLSELPDITEQIDGFIPTATLIALYVGWRQGHIGSRHAPATTPTSPPTPLPRGRRNP